MNQFNQCDYPRYFSNGGVCEGCGYPTCISFAKTIDTKRINKLNKKQVDKVYSILKNI